jgi:hypothetical protein
MRLRYINGIGKQYMVNEYGYYGDFIIGAIPKENIQNLDTLDVDKIQVVLYPSYDEILKYRENILKSNAILVLNPTQEKEIQFISSYFKHVELPFNVAPFFGFLGLYLSFHEVKELAKTHLSYRIIYVYLQTRDYFGLNPSNFYKVDFKDYHLLFSKLDFKNIQQKDFPHAYEYYVKAKGHFDLNIFCSLLYSELTEYIDERIAYLLQLIQEEDIAKIHPKNYDLEIIAKYTKEIAWMKQDGFLFMMGGLGD